MIIRTEEVIKGLDELEAHCESMADKEDPESIWKHDVEVLRAAKTIIHSRDQIAEEMNELYHHFVAAQEPEWDSKNRFWRCPSCKRRILEYHGFCKHCGKKVDWMPLMKKRKKEAEIRGRKDRKKDRSCKE